MQIIDNTMTSTMIDTSNEGDEVAVVIVHTLVDSGGDDVEAWMIIPSADSIDSNASSSSSSSDDNNDNDDHEIFPPLEQSHMGSIQRDLTLVVQLSFFAVLYGSTAHSASRAMRLLYVMLSLMVYLPRIMPLLATSESSPHNIIVLVAMGGFLYWLVLTPTWLWHLLMMLGMIILCLQSQSLLLQRTTAATTTKSITRTVILPTILKRLHVLTTLSSMLAMTTCLFLLPHYLAFHCALVAYVLYAVAAVMQAKLDQVTAAEACACDNEDGKHNDIHPTPTILPKQKDSFRHSSPCSSLQRFYAASTIVSSSSPASTTTNLFTTNFAVGLQPHPSSRAVFTMVLGPLILPVLLSMLLLISCILLPDAPWLAVLAAFVLSSTLCPLWLLTMDQPSLSSQQQPPTAATAAAASTASASESTWLWSLTTTNMLTTTLTMIWTMPLRIHVRSNASIVIETLATTMVYDNAVRASCHYYGRNVDDDMTTSMLPMTMRVASMDQDMKKKDDHHHHPRPPTWRRARRRRSAVRQQVVLVELHGSRFLRLAPEDPDGLIQAIHMAAAAMLSNNATLEGGCDRAVTAAV